MTREQLIIKLTAELEYVKKTTQEGDSVDCFARVEQYIFPLFSEFIKSMITEVLSGIGKGSGRISKKNMAILNQLKGEE